MDISILSCALALDLDASNQVSAIRIAYGGIADRPMRLTALEKLVTGQVWNLETVESAIDWVESNLRPLDDHRASAVYRRQAAAGLLMAAFQCEVQP